MCLFWSAGCPQSHPTCTVLLSGSVFKWPPPPPLQPPALLRPPTTHQVPDPAAPLLPTAATRTAPLSVIYVWTPPRMQWSACVDTFSGKKTASGSLLSLYIFMQFLYYNPPHPRSRSVWLIFLYYWTTCEYTGLFAFVNNKHHQLYFWYLKLFLLNCLSRIKKQYHLTQFSNF